MSNLTLAEARTALDAALTRGSSLGAKPLAVVILDAGGHPVAFARQDGASLFRFDIARAKAQGAIGMGADTRTLAARAKESPAFFQSVSAAVGGAIAYSPGGVLIRSEGGEIRGAIGISGDTGDCDEDCALAGIAAMSAREGKPT